MTKQDSIFRSVLLAGIIVLMAHHTAAQVERTSKETTKMQFLSNPRGVRTNQSRDTRGWLSPNRASWSTCRGRCP